MATLTWLLILGSVLAASPMARSTHAADPTQNGLIAFQLFGDARGAVRAFMSSAAMAVACIASHISLGAVPGLDGRPTASAC